MTSKTLKLEDMNRMEKDLIEDLRMLDQRQYNSRSKLKTDQHTISNKIIKFKPSSQEKKGYVLSELPVENKPSTYHRSNKQNNSSSNLIKKSFTKPQDCAQLKHKSIVSPKSGLPAKNIPPATNRNSKLVKPKYVADQYLSERFITETLRDSVEHEQLLFDDSLEFNISPKVMEGENINITKILKEKKKYNQQGIGSMECTFKPSILKKSKEIADKLIPSFSRLTQKPKTSNKENQYRESTGHIRKYSKERINALSKPRQVVVPVIENQDEECSFKPVLSKKSLLQYNDCHMDVIERNQLWLKEREMKIVKMRHEEEKQKIEKEEQQRLLAMPSSEYKGDKEVYLSKFVKEGLVQYFQRIQLASDLKKREKDVELKFSGKGWNGSSTKTKEFKLSGFEKPKHKGILKGGQKQYEKAIKQLHEKILNLDL